MPYTGLECSVKCDMFSAACALMEMWLFRAPFLSGPKPSVRSHLAIMQKVLGQLPEYLMKNAYKAQKGEPGLVNKPEANSSNNEQSPRYTLDWPTSKTLQQMKDHVENVPTLNVSVPYCRFSSSSGKLIVCACLGHIRYV